MADPLFFYLYLWNVVRKFLTFSLTSSASHSNFKASSSQIFGFFYCPCSEDYTNPIEFCVPGIHQSTSAHYHSLTPSWEQATKQPMSCFHEQTGSKQTLEARNRASPLSNRATWKHANRKHAAKLPVVASV